MVEQTCKKRVVKTVDLKKYHEWMRRDKRTGSPGYEKNLEHQGSDDQPQDQNEAVDGPIYFVKADDESAVEAFIKTFLGPE
jgi:hypothetical protein